MKFLILNFLIILVGVNGQFNYYATEGYLNQSVLDYIFTKYPPTQRPTKPNFDPTSDLGNNGLSGFDNCECVSYAECKNETINTDGTNIIDIKMNNGLCSHYLLTCCKKENIIVPTVTTQSSARRLSRSCGNHHPNGVGFKIKGHTNSESQFGEFPWMVAVLREENTGANIEVLLVYTCGGSLIHPQVVLTAAHCVEDINKKFRIRAGEWDTQTKNENLPYQDRLIESITIHPEYYRRGLFYDVALLVLDSPVEIADNVEPVCLPEQDEYLDLSRCYASGWGKTVFEKRDEYQVILKKIELPIVERNDCQRKLRRTRLGRFFLLNKSFICAGGEAGKDTCSGDGGSPLVCHMPGHPGKLYQRGIVSWGVGCNTPDVPGVYGNVAAFRNWIDDRMQRLNFDTSSYTL